jgi:hypothetical protein
MENPSVSMIPFPTCTIPDGDHPNLCYGNPPQQGNQG